jgi:hypothetical protein
VGSTSIVDRKRKTSLLVDFVDEAALF